MESKSRKQLCITCDQNNLYDVTDKGSGNGSDNDDARNTYLSNFCKDYELARVNFQELFDKGSPPMLPYKKLLSEIYVNKHFR